MRMLLLCAAIALAGCGIENPYPGSEQQRRSEARPSDAEPPVDRRDPDAYQGGDAHAAVASGDAAELVRAYALASGNWSWRTYARQYERMLALAGGELRGHLQATPPDPGVLRTLERQRQTNRAEVVSLDLQRGDIAIVVLLEQAGNGGRVDANPVHTVYRARVGTTSIGPRVVGWERLP